MGSLGPHNGGVTITGDTATETARDRVRLDRPILVSNLVSGALLLSPLAFLSWPLLLLGVVYIVAGSVFLAVVYARRALTRRQEALAWVTPWLVAVALWSVVVMSTEFENSLSHYLFGLYVGLLIATPCYLAWQIVALAVRQFMAWRSGKSSLPT
jgi:ABC-type Na+ efflux pump permease subunit